MIIINYEKERLAKIVDVIQHMLESCRRLSGVISILPDKIDDYLNRLDFNNKLTKHIREKVLNLFKKYKFNSTRNFIKSYVNCIECHVDVLNDMSVVYSWDDSKFDRNRQIKTEYTTSDNVHIIHFIQSGKIIDMIDAGRDDFKIHATNGKVVVGDNGIRYRYVVYRATRKNHNKSYSYRKEFNYRNYNYKKKRQKIKLVPEGQEIIVHGSKNSKFGFGLYNKITKLLTDKNTVNDIYGKSIDDIIYFVLHVSMATTISLLKSKSKELANLIKK